MCGVAGRLLGGAQSLACWGSAPRAGGDEAEFVEGDRDVKIGDRSVDARGEGPRGVPGVFLDLGKQRVCGDIERHARGDAAASVLDNHLRGSHVRTADHGLSQ